MSPLARNASIAAAYAVGVVLFFEGTSRVLLSSAAFFRRVAGEDDASWRLRWAKRQSGQRPIYYTFDAFHPIRGWTLRPGIRDMKAFGERILNSNSKGIRGQAERGYERPPGTLRILVLGDSFTFGEEVSDDETYAHTLEEMTPGVEVLNFGVHGYGHDQMLLYLQEEGVKYHPDIVLLGFLYDDMFRNTLSFRDYAKPRFDLEGGRLVLRNTPLPPPEQTRDAEPYRSKFGDLLTMLRAKSAWRSGRTPETMKGVTLAILDEVRRVSERIGAEPVFAYLPVYGELNKPDLNMTWRERFFFDGCRQRGLTCLYLGPAFLEKRRQGTEFKTSGHWGPLEHHTAAEAIHAGLSERLLLRPSWPRVR